jgi:hypothetical protein
MTSSKNMARCSNDVACTCTSELLLLLGDGLLILLLAASCDDTNDVYKWTQ